MNFEGLTITIGAPGSGKSTWADETLPLTTLRLERDRFREALFGSRRGYHEHLLSQSSKSFVVTSAMSAAQHAWPTMSWAVTDTGLRYESVKPFIDFALFNNAPVRLIVFDRDDAFLLTNNRIRPHAHRIPEDILLSMIEMFHDRHAWWRTSSHETIYV